MRELEASYLFNTGYSTRPIDRIKRYLNATLCKLLGCKPGPNIRFLGSIDPASDSLTDVMLIPVHVCVRCRKLHNVQECFSIADERSC